MIRLAHGDTEAESQPGTDTGTAQLSSLLNQLNAYSDSATRVRPPSPSEAMAIYSVAVRLVRLQMALTDRGAGEAADVDLTRDLLLGTRRMLRAALDRLEPTSPPQLTLLTGGSRHRA